MRYKIMGPVEAEVGRLEQQSIASKAIFACIQGQIEVSEDQFMYHMRRFQILEINRVFGRCPQPYGCNEYIRCKRVICDKEFLTIEKSTLQALENIK